jgi:signal transduction histidine kinase
MTVDVLPIHPRRFASQCVEVCRSPLNWVAAATWLAVTLIVLEPARLRAGDLTEWAGLAALLSMWLAYLLLVWNARREGAENLRAEMLMVLQGFAVLLADYWLAEGQTSILLIVVAGQLMHLPQRRRAVAWLLLFNLLMLVSWTARLGHPAQVLLWMMPMLAFQAFSALTSHYHLRAEQTRDALAAANAELLATQCLLEQSARAGERLALSRELHDVAGHKLTALKLHLRRLTRDSQLADREEVRISSELADELLADIRGVVSELRRHDGLDLRESLQALARPIPGVSFALQLDPDLRVADVAQAEALLRIAQEGITNALRHARSQTLRLSCRRDGAQIELCVESDGPVAMPIQFGNGLTGIQERLQALDGELQLQALTPSGLRLCARLPDAPA